MQTFSTFLPYLQIGLAVILTALVLIQQSESSIGSAFGGDSMGANYRSRRGGDLVIFRVTIVVGVIFVLLAIANLFL